MLAVSLGLVTWFGHDRVQARLATLWQAETWRNDRISLVSRLLPAAAAFPLWGTGYGTFDCVEPSCRVEPAEASRFAAVP